jgi:hypothetical protein
VVSSGCPTGNETHVLWLAITYTSALTNELFSDPSCRYRFSILMSGKNLLKFSYSNLSIPNILRYLDS